MELSYEAMLIAVVIAAIASLIGGMIGGMVLGGKDIGYQLSAMMGGFFGPIAGIWGVIVGLTTIYIYIMMGV